MTDLLNALKVFYEQAEQRHLFWQDRLPVNFINGRFFSGLNLLLLGTHRLNYQDPHWICSEQLQDLNQIPDDTSDIQNIISWQDEGSYNRCRILSCFNLKSLDVTTIKPSFSPDSDLNFFDDRYIPYNNHPDTRYDALNQKILVNNSLNRISNLDPLIRFYLHKEKLPFYLRTDLLSGYLQYVFSLTKVRLLQFFGKETFYFDNFNLVLETIKELYQQNHHLALLYGYIHSDRVINAMFNYEKHQLKESVLSLFMPEERAYQMLNRLTKQHLNLLIENMNKCLEQNKDNHQIAFLHFVSSAETEKEDFYVTNLQDNVLFGVVSNQKNCFYQQLTKDDADERYVLDILFTPKKIS